VLGAFNEADFNPGPESFFLRTTLGQKVSAVLDFLDFSAAGVKVVTYQALVRVKGKVRFAIVENATNTQSGDSVLDEVVIDSPSVYSDLTLVTVRAQVKADLNAHVFKVRIENMTSSAAQIQVTTQQAWGGKEGENVTTGYPLELGLANQTFVTTADNAKSRNRYQWSVNALGVMALSRLRIPAKPQKYGWEQRGFLTSNREVADLRDGDVYHDTDQVALLMVMNDQMFCVHQPERTVTKDASFQWDPGEEKNVMIAANASTCDVTLNHDTAAVPDGTTVRVYRNLTGTAAVNVKAGTGPGMLNVAITAGKMGEFVFMGGKWRSTQLNVDFAAQA
jgi:hypothetical protein